MFYNKQRALENDNNPQQIVKVLKSPDDFISFRHVKPFDSENLDLLEEDSEDSSSNSSLKFKSVTNNNSQVKFNEILTGSEVKRP